MQRPLQLSLLLLATVSLPAAGQTRLPKPTILAPTVIAPPASLTATGTTNSILLTFPGVTGASGYRVTRTNNAGDPETMIFEGPLDKFAFNGAACSPSQGCAYNDIAVLRGYLYSYRVYSLFPSASGPPVVSPPGPVASAQVKFARLR